jgi:hypothetical protein
MCILFELKFYPVGNAISFNWNFSPIDEEDISIHTRGRRQLTRTSSIFSSQVKPGFKRIDRPLKFAKIVQWEHEEPL